MSHPRTAVTPVGADLRRLDVEPVSVRAPFDLRLPGRPVPGTMFVEHERALRAELAGVELGAYDERIVAWLARCDVPTVGALISLLGRVRAAGGQPSSPDSRCARS